MPVLSGVGVEKIDYIGGLVKPNLTRYLIRIAGGIVMAEIRVYVRVFENPDPVGRRALDLPKHLARAAKVVDEEVVPEQGDIPVRRIRAWNGGVYEFCGCRCSEGHEAVCSYPNRRVVGAVEIEGEGERNGSVTVIGI